MFFRMRSFFTESTENSDAFHEIKTLYEIIYSPLSTPDILVNVKSYYIQKDTEVKMYFVHDNINKFNYLIGKNGLIKTFLPKKITFKLRRH